MKNTLIFGHRGASGHAPENTIAAFELACHMGADGVELDAKLSKDGHVMVIHDRTVDRTTGVSGKVCEWTKKELQTLDASYRFSEKFPGEKIPTLAQVFESVGRKMIINVELTNYANPYDDLPDKVADLVRRFKLEKMIIFSSFSFRTLKRITALLPEVPAGILALPGIPGFFSRSGPGRKIAPKLLHPYYADVNKALIQKAHANQRGVNVWTVNSKDEMRRLVKFGVDGIITDDIPLALKIRSQTK